MPSRDAIGLSLAPVDPEVSPRAPGWAASPGRTRPVRRRILAVVAVSTLATACSLGQGDSSAGGVENAAPAVTVDIDPDNALIAHATVTTSSPAPVSLTFESADIGPRRMVSPEESTSHEFTVVGLRAQTEYEFEASTAGGSSASDPVTLATGALPGDAPTVEVVQAAEDESADSDAGITFFGVNPQQIGNGPAYFGVDPGGVVVWYLESDEPPKQGPVIRDLGDGQLLAFFHDTIERVDLAGDVKQVYDMTAAGPWHHDAVPMPGGGMLTLSSEKRTIEGEDVRGDTIVELDSSGNVVWTWSSFEHLDTTRYPGGLARAQAPSGGGTDWTHANSVTYDEENDDILLSVRSQSWVVDIDHGTGDVRWIAGDDAGIDPGFDARFLTLLQGSWFSGQHAAMITTDGKLLVYDNRNETGGEQGKSRAVAYDLDLDAGTARQTFEYIAPKYTSSLGDVDELAGGHVLVTAGGPAGQESVDDTAHIVETDQQGQALWELAIKDTRIYQAERVSWNDLGQEVR